MRDGTRLIADVYRPGAAGRYPVLLQRTPYGRGQWPVTALTLDPLRAAAAGYVVVIQDVRARGASEGQDFFPYRDEFRDGFDSVEWAAALPSSDGRVGAYGASYMGAAAWHAATEAPPSLRAIATATAPNDFYANHLWRGGAFLLGTFLNWSLLAIGPGALLRAQPSRFGERMAELADAIDGFDAWVWHRPLRSMPPARPDDDTFLPFFFEVLRHETHDQFTTSLSTTGRHERVTVPALIFGGWHDPFLRADLDHFQAMRDSAGSPRARDGTRLVIGPWSHGSFLSTVGSHDFGIRASGLFLDLRQDLTAMHLIWFARELDGEAVGAQDDRVQVFVQGTNRWRTLPDWPPRARTEDWYLSPGGALTRSAPEGEHAPDEFVYDPEDPCPTCGGALLMPRTYQPGPADQHPLLGRGDVLIYTSEQLRQPLAAAGPVHVILYCATSAPDTDWVAKLCSVDQHGRTVSVCDGILRASSRHGLDRRVPVEPLVFHRYKIDLWATAMVFAPGHRLRLLVSSSDFPRYDRNPNTGEAGLTATSFQPARQAVGCDLRWPSHVTLPIVDWQ